MPQSRSFTKSFFEQRKAPLGNTFQNFDDRTSQDALLGAQGDRRYGSFRRTHSHSGSTGAAFVPLDLCDLCDQKPLSLPQGRAPGRQAERGSGPQRSQRSTAGGDAVAPGAELPEPAVLVLEPSEPTAVWPDTDSECEYDASALPAVLAAGSGGTTPPMWAGAEHGGLELSSRLGSHHSSSLTWPDTDNEYDGDDGLDSRTTASTAVLSYAAPSPSRAGQDTAPPLLSTSAPQAEPQPQPQGDGGQQEITTIMIRNLPKGLTQKQLLDELNTTGYAGLYDFCYMPRCFKNSENQGYAFANFTSAAAALALTSDWHRQHRFGMCPTTAPLTIRPADLQGLEANLERWDTTRLRRIRNPDYLPFVRRASRAEGPLEGPASRGLPGRLRRGSGSRNVRPALGPMPPVRTAPAGLPEYPASSPLSRNGPVQAPRITLSIASATEYQ